MNKKRIWALMLLFVFVIGLGAPAALAGDTEEEKEIRIHDAAGLRQLSVDCALDGYSDGLTVILEANIDLGGEGFYSIPVFNGTFEGNDHTITGLKTAGDGSYQGFFRYLLKDAVVRDLKLAGTVTPANGKECVGGLAGSNSGLIENCSFTGTVSGVNRVGGIAGENIGRILDCSFAGDVNGKRFTGGIAGYSEGLIKDCENTGSINTTVSESVLRLEDITGVNTAPIELLNAEDENVVSDSGGVVGFSKGIVQNCVNRGKVGYQHFGYNVGGIAGRQSGYLTECKNYGEILGRKDVAGIVGQMEPYLELVDSANLAEEIALLNDYMNAASNDLAQMSAELDDARSEMDAGNGNLNNELGLEGTISPAGEAGDSSGSINDNSNGSISRPDSHITDEDMDNIRDTADDKADIEIPKEVTADRVNATSDDLYSTASGIDRMYGILGDTSGNLAYDLTNANNQFSRVLTLMSNALNNGANMNIFDDVSEELTEEDVEGRVSRSENYGSVSADSNVGGIAGSMGIEYEFDVEDQLVETVGANGIISNTYDAKCISSSNVNLGSVLAKKDRVGGVVGSSEMGVILSCEGYGNVESTEGGYVGGIAGYSGTSVRSCYAMCDLSGENYVGGIVGYGKEVTDCASMIDAANTSANLGAIAGWADMATEGAVDGNIFVHDWLGAVDGISYLNRAMPVTYEELISREDVPEGFHKLRVRFLVDGEIIKELLCDYGGKIAASQIPDVPQREGCSGRWSAFEAENLRFNQVIEAIYTLNQSTLATVQTREGSPLSLALVEGDFEEGVSLSIAPYEGESPVVENGRTLEQWTLRLENLPGDVEPVYQVRYYAPGTTEKRGEILIYRLGEEGWKQIDATKLGSYRSFSAEGEKIVFAAVEVVHPVPNTWYIAGAAGGALLLIGLAAGFIYTGKKKKARAAAKTAAEAE